MRAFGLAALIALTACGTDKDPGDTADSATPTPDTDTDTDTDTDIGDSGDTDTGTAYVTPALECAADGQSLVGGTWTGVCNAQIFYYVWPYYSIDLTLADDGGVLSGSVTQAWIYDTEPDGPNPDYFGGALDFTVDVEGCRTGNDVVVRWYDPNHDFRLELVATLENDVLVPRYDPNDTDAFPTRYPDFFIYTVGQPTALGKGTCELVRN